MGAAAGLHVGDHGGDVSEEERVEMFKEVSKEFEKLNSDNATEAFIARSLQTIIMEKYPAVYRSIAEDHILTTAEQTRLLIEYCEHTGKRKAKFVKSRNDIENIRKSVENDKQLKGRFKSMIIPSGLSDSDHVTNMCKKTINNINLRNAHTFVVGVDGSERSQNAFNVAMSLRKGRDLIEILHVYDPNGESDLPSYLKSEKIHEFYSNELTSKLIPEKWKIQIIEKNGYTTRQAVNKYVNGILALEDLHNIENNNPRASFLVIGYSGRKNSKDDKTVEVMGSTTDIALRNTHLPCIIVKKKPSEEKRNVFLVCVTMSEKCFEGLLMTLNIAKPRDTVIVFHVVKSLNEAEIEALKIRYESEFDDRGLEHATFVTKNSEGKGTVETILEYANEIAADFITVSPNPQTVISVSEKIIKKSDQSLIIVKH